MCRILYMETKTAVDPQGYLKSFAEMARASVEYQGHGWGCAWQTPRGWDFYWSIRPVWKDDFSAIPATRRLLVHARSAFRDQGIAIENNMPFYRLNTVFVFNGELHGVRIKEAGRIGAEKIFNFILRLKRDDLLQAVLRAVAIIKKRSSYIRAMNLIVVDQRQTVLSTVFNERPDYFTMYRHQANEQLLVCSEPLSIVKNWAPIANQTTEEIKR
ncbi:class II glutamine amidotransferase [Calditrichota bacterium GD2]